MEKEVWSVGSARNTNRGNESEAKKVVTMEQEVFMAYKVEACTDVEFSLMPPVMQFSFVDNGAN